jgi:hypothetical protein
VLAKHYLATELELGFCRFIVYDAEEFRTFGTASRQEGKGIPRSEPASDEERAIADTSGSPAEGEAAEFGSLGAKGSGHGIFVFFGEQTSGMVGLPTSDARADIGVAWRDLPATDPSRYRDLIAEARRRTRAARALLDPDVAQQVALARRDVADLPGPHGSLRSVGDIVARSRLDLHSKFQQLRRCSRMVTATQRSSDVVQVPAVVL